jgi:DNA-binding CsgD family transcriptional regulator
MPSITKEPLVRQSGDKNSIVEAEIIYRGNTDPFVVDRGDCTDVAVDAYLAHWSAKAEQRRWLLASDRGVVTVGRAVSADVCLTGDARISRVHAVLERVAGQWTIVDDGLSLNGTFLNGRRLPHRVRLRDRDKIRVGQTVLTFCAPPQTATQQTMPGGGLPAVPRLTDRQHSVLVALCRPYRDAPRYGTAASNLQIAKELFLSLHAVKTHLRVLFHKFGIDALPQNQKRARLVELALQLGLVDEIES